MSRLFRKTFVAASLLLVLSASSVQGDITDNLPDMGTTGAAVLSVAQEMQMGDFYVRQLRASAPLIDDPLLTQYINRLGQRLVTHAWSVKNPFHFYLFENDQLNAFAFLAVMWYRNLPCFAIRLTKASLPR